MAPACLSALTAAVFTLTVSPASALRSDSSVVAVKSAEVSAHTAKDFDEDDWPTSWPLEHQTAADELLGKWQDNKGRNYSFDFDYGHLELTDFHKKQAALLTPVLDSLFECEVNGKMLRFNLHTAKWSTQKGLSVEVLENSVLGTVWMLVDSFTASEKEFLNLRHVFTSSLSPAMLALAGHLLGTWKHATTPKTTSKTRLSNYLGLDDENAATQLAFNVTQDGEWEVAVNGASPAIMNPITAVFEGFYNGSISSDLQRVRLTAGGTVVVESMTKHSSWFIANELFHPDKAIDMLPSKHEGFVFPHGFHGGVAQMSASVLTLMCAALFTFIAM